jgi:hypothetical protein
MNNEVITYLNFFNHLEEEVQDIFTKIYPISEIYKMYVLWLEKQSYGKDYQETEFEMKAKIAFVYIDKFRARGEDNAYTTQRLKLKIAELSDKLTKLTAERDMWRDKVNAKDLPVNKGRPVIDNIDLDEVEL